MRFSVLLTVPLIALGCAANADEIDATDDALTQTRELDAKCGGYHAEYRCWNGAPYCDTFSGADGDVHMKLPVTRNGKTLSFGQLKPLKEEIVVSTSPVNSPWGLIPAYDTTRRIELHEGIDPITLNGSGYGHENLGPENDILGTKGSLSASTEGTRVMLHYESTIVDGPRLGAGGGTEWESKQHWACDFVWE